MQSCGSLATLTAALLMVMLPLKLVAQAHGDAEDARIDALFGTPNRYGVAPPDNFFATTPGLEQQARRSTFIFNGLAPISYSSNAMAGPSGVPTNQNSALFNPVVGLSWAT